MELQGKHWLVIGLGRTGVAASRFLARKKAWVRACDGRKAQALNPEVWALAEEGVELRAGEENPSLLKDIEGVLPSPGVPANHPLLCEALRRGIPIWSEIELAFRSLSFPLLALTGTNGKSTTTLLLGSMIERAGWKVFIGGNLGTPLIEAVDHPYDLGVVEVSSFQLEWVHTFRPHIGLFLNLSADHLDRYPNLDSYRGAKKKLFTQQTSQDWAVLNREDPLVWALAPELPSRVTSFGWKEVFQGTFFFRDQICFRSPEGKEERFSLRGFPLPGPHNVENAMAATTAARLWGVAREAIEEALRTFSGLSHRLELVAEKRGVRYVDDSKGTNVGAVVRALESFCGPIILLAGGLDKGGDFTLLKTPVRKKVKRLVLFGRDREKLLRVLKHQAPVDLVDTLEEAVQVAATHAQPGDTVLLSPGCASWDQFKDYAERGQAFRAAVEALFHD